MYTLLRTAKPKNHTLSSGTSPYSPNKGVAPPVSIHQTLMAHFTLLVSSVSEANVLHKEQKGDVVLLYIAGITAKTKNTSQANQEELFV